jgi:voltage-gated potassium channel
MIALLARLLRQPHGRHVLVLLGLVVFVIIVGGAAFSVAEHVPVTTGIYWAVVTATTVGYGDVIPKDPTTRLIAVIVMLTTIPMLGTVFALVTGSVTISRINQLLHTGGGRMAPEGFRLVLGMHPATPALLEELAVVKEPIVLVADVDPATLPHSVRLVKGEPTETHVLRSAEPHRAQQALIAAKTDGDALVCAVLLRELAPKLAVAAVASAPPVIDALKDLGVAQVISGERVVSHVLAKSLEAPHASDLLLTLLDSDRHRLVEETVSAGDAGKCLSALRGEREELLLGVVQDGRVSLGIGEDPQLKVGDTLLLGVPEAGERRRG